MDKKSVTVVVPVLNEEVDIPKNIPILHKFLRENLKEYDWEIVIVDNASTDGTARVSKELAQKEGIKYMRLEERGRGRALKKAWSESKSEILSYMDVDLSSDISFFPKLIKAIEDGSDIAIGSRLKSGAKVYNRPLIREIFSRSYSFLFRTLFWTSFTDAQCGFKAITKNAWTKLSSLVEDNGWFFDSELLIIADKGGFKISEVPITWRDDPNSTVKVAKTAWKDIEGLIRLVTQKPWKKLKSL